MIYSMCAISSHNCLSRIGLRLYGPMALPGLGYASA